MLEMINERREAEKEEHYNLFSSLLDANDLPSNNSDIPLTERKLMMGNISIFLLTRHETTAHTLAFTFVLLAFYQEEQDILYQHIKSSIPGDRILTYEKMPLFTQSMALILSPSAFAPLLMRTKGETLMLVRMTTMEVPLAGYVLPAGSFLLPLVLLSNLSDEVVPAYSTGPSMRSLR
ncbi:hypothetical protein AAF712_016043, partial [Marasmius tenuissimus]